MEVEWGKDVRAASVMHEQYPLKSILKAVGYFRWPLLKFKKATVANKRKRENCCKDYQEQFYEIVLLLTSPSNIRAHIAWYLEAFALRYILFYDHAGIVSTETKSITKCSIYNPVLRFVESEV